MDVATIKKLFPHASQSTIRRNLDLSSVGAGQAQERKPDPVSALEREPKVLSRSPRRLEVRIAIIRIGPRLLDSDNATYAAKPLRDAIAASLGVDDADPRLEWEYLQIKSSGSPGVLVKIEIR
jgi:hypothetical protein